MAGSFTAEFPPYFDEYEPEIEAKGYFADLTLRIEDTVLRPTFYDPVRLGQECGDGFAAGSAYAGAPLLIIVPTVTRAAITTALEALAAGNFSDLMGSSWPASFEEALAAPDPTLALRDAAVRARAAGAGRDAVERQLHALRAHLAETGRDQDVVLDVLDFLAGWSSPHMHIE